MKLPLWWLLVVGGTLWAQTDWRRSDPLGGDKGPGVADRVSGWVLRVKTEASRQERTLFHDGKEDSVKVVDLDPSGRIVRERDLREGIPIWEAEYDPATGLPTSEITFQDGEPERTATLTYERGILTQRVVTDSQGIILYTDRLLHWPDGSLRRLERLNPEGPGPQSAWSYGTQGPPQGAWVVTEDDAKKGTHHEWIYSGGKTEEKVLAAEGPMSTKTTERLASGDTRETTAFPGISRVEKRLLDSQGRTVEEIVEVKGEVQRLARWTFDAQGRLSSSSVDTVTAQEAWDYTYRDGKTWARLSRDGVPVREEVTQNGEKLSVSLYDRGSLFLVETWEGGKKVKETYYRNGAILRERVP